MRIQPFHPLPNPKAISKTEAMENSNAKSAGNGLGSTFEKMFNEVENQQQVAEAKQTELLTSPNKDIHGTMIEMEKAEVSLRLLMQVRNKLTSAYEEIMRMQV